jgi:uncharacterized membrane protein YphA (DoxX/SURF4 family)
MERVERLRGWLESHRPSLFEWLRIYLGVALFVRGVAFFTDPTVLAVVLQGRSLPADYVIGHAVGLAHLAGGLMLAFGVVTRLAAAVQLPVVLGAAFLHAREGFSLAIPTLELALLVGFLLVLVVFHGGGKWSLDGWLAREFREHHPPQTAP